jgi:hypothetical protein
MLCLFSPRSLAPLERRRAACVTQTKMMQPIAGEKKKTKVAILTSPKGEWMLVRKMLTKIGIQSDFYLYENPSADGTVDLSPS